MAESVLRWFRRGRRSAADATCAFDITAFEPALATRLLILQPTPFCNIACDYCYLPQRHVKARMGIATAALAARRLVEDGLLGPELTVVWHAGEPLTLPPSYYDEALDAIADAIGTRTTLRHSIQTNAMLIDDAWCELIARRGIRIGVSVDGPAHLHDAHRRTRDGKGTHAQAQRGMARLRAAGIPFHAIAVVTRRTLTEADAFADYFEAAGVTELGCNFDEAEGLHTRSSLAGHEAAHRVFLERLIERASRPGSPLVVRELTRARQLITTPLPRMHWRGEQWPLNWQVLPFALVTVAHDGRFSTFSPELLAQPAPEFDDFVFGDVATGGCLAATANPAFLRAWARIVDGVRACERGCAYFGYCGGGAPANKLYELGDLAGTETLYCRTMVQRPFDAALTFAERMIAQARQAASA